MQAEKTRPPLLAEQNSDLIFEILNTLGKPLREVDMLQDTGVWRGQLSDFDCSGLYVFYIQKDEEWARVGEDLPKQLIYVGYTTNIRDRIEQHYSYGKNDTPIRWHEAAGLAKKHIDIWVAFIKLSSISAKVMESVLLYSFDFLRNEKENGAEGRDGEKRDKLEKGVVPRDTALKLFKENYLKKIAGTMQEIKGFNESMMAL